MDSTNHNRNEPGDLPARDAWLLSYLDGELGHEERVRVEAWLAEDAATRADVQVQRRLNELFAEADIDEPAPSAWDDTLAGIESGLRSCPTVAPAPRPSRRARPVLWVAAAAAVIAGVWLGAGWLFGPRPLPHNPVPGRPVLEKLEVASESDVTIDDMDPLDERVLIVGRMPGNLPEELRQLLALEVAGSEEIAIITMNGEDTDKLVVGEPPVSGSLIMASSGEVKVHHIAPRKKNSPQPFLQESASGGMPMIVVPFRSESVRKD